MTKMAVIGFGLIGGSMALSWKQAGLVDEVIACGHREESLKLAKEMGAADSWTTSIPEAVKDADIVVVAVPVQAMEKVFSDLADYLKPDAVVTDVGSTRMTVIEAAKKGLKEKFRQYAPGHPIAGGELPGVAYATKDLFNDKWVISTPTDEMDPEKVKFIEDAWTKAGAKIKVMSPELHDAIFASVSHLPHVLAYALVDMITKEKYAKEKLGMAGAGFRDFTRIAASSPAMWRDICLSNRAAISKELKRYRQELEELQEAIDNSDAQKLEACFENAMKNRRGLVFSASKQDPGKDDGRSKSH